MDNYGHPFQRDGGSTRVEAAAVEITLSAHQLKPAKSKANSSGNSGDPLLNSMAKLPGMWLFGKEIMKNESTPIVTLYTE